MIVFCGRCDTEPVVLETVDGPLALDWFGHYAERPWCANCILGCPLIQAAVQSALNMLANILQVPPMTIDADTL